MPSIFEKLFKGKTPAAPASAPSQTAPSQPSPGAYETVYAKALAAAAVKDFDRAIPLYDQAIALSPASAEPYYKRANALKDAGRFEAAVASYDQAIERKPDYAFAYCNRGVIQHRLGSLAAAVASLDQAIALEPTDAVAHYNRALVLQDCCRWDEAVASYDRAIEINPEYSDAHYNRALTLLFLGDFERGWPGFEWRWDNAQRLAIGAARKFQEPLWLGHDPIAGKRLLLHNEAGLGDTLQFCRYAKVAAARGASVLLQVQPPLAGLLSNLEGVSQVIPAGGTLPPFDYHCPMMSLPLAFKTTVDTVPAWRSYLHNDSGKIAQWRRRLGERTRPRVGLAWSGNPNNPLDPRRTIRLADWLTQLPTRFEYFCLQKDVRPEDRVARDSSSLITSFDDELPDFTNNAALCECMDIVISIDTSVAHLSGALGQRTWVLLPAVPDWRWMRDREDTPWYPTMKLYRQKAAGDWCEVFARIAADLQREFPTG